jgi:hypothetical protein
VGGVTADPVTYVRISEPEELPSIEHYRPFRAVVVLEGTYTDEWQDKVSGWLIDSGCLYMMAWGPNCSSWDDSVDYAQTQKYLPDEAPDEEFVMTTWHNDESLEDVLWFAQFCAHDPYDMIKHTLLLHVGDTDREIEFRALFERSKTLAEREDKGV